MARAESLTEDGGWPSAQLIVASALAFNDAVRDHLQRVMIIFFLQLSAAAQRALEIRLSARRRGEIAHRSTKDGSLDDHGLLVEHWRAAPCLVPSEYSACKTSSDRGCVLSGTDLHRRRDPIVILAGLSLRIGQRNDATIYNIVHECDLALIEGRWSAHL